MLQPSPIALRCLSRAAIALFGCVAFLASCASPTPVNPVDLAVAPTATIAIPTSTPPPGQASEAGQAISDDSLATPEPIQPVIATTTPTPMAKDGTAQVDGLVDGLVDPRAVVDRLTLDPELWWRYGLYDEVIATSPKRGQSVESVLADYEDVCASPVARDTQPRPVYSFAEEWFYDGTESELWFINASVNSWADEAHAQRSQDLSEMFESYCYSSDPNSLYDLTVIYESDSVPHDAFPASHGVDQVLVQHASATDPTEEQLAIGVTPSPGSIFVTVRHGSLSAFANIHAVSEGQIAARLPLAATLVEQLIAAMDAEIASEHRLPAVGFVD